MHIISDFKTLFFKCLKVLKKATLKIDSVIGFAPDSKQKMHTGKNKYGARVLFVFFTILIFLTLIHILKLQNKIKNDEYKKNPDSQIGIEDEKQSEPISIRYNSQEKKINGLLQKIHTITVDLSQREFLIYPQLSFNRIFGYQILSEIAKNNGAYAAINAGFFYVNGYPSGMLIKDGRIITPSSGKYPVLIISDDVCELKNIATSVKISINDMHEIPVNLNPRENLDGYNLYTYEYGSKNRFRGENITAVVKNGVVEKVYATDGESHIPKEGFIISASLNENMSMRKFALKAGDDVKIITDPQFDKNTQAYECGAWLVRAGKNVAPDFDAWIGGLNTREPRTAVAVKGNKNILFIVIDGRQPSYSYGVTARELADIIIDMGYDYAAMLDGGASSQMIFKDAIVNRPSFKGEERPLGGGIIIKSKK